MWIPWADNGDQFSEHFLQILIFNPRPQAGTDAVDIVYVYQSGDYVRTFFGLTLRVHADPRFFEFPDRALSSAYNPDAPKVDGESKSGGERRVIFYDKKDGSVGFKFEIYGR